MNRLQAGYRLGDRYTLGDRIASGGMGDVWRSRDDVLERTVAIKVLRPTTDAAGGVFARRFRDEALFAATLAHPTIATVFDYGEEDTLAYLVMELVPGEPLSAVVRRDGALPPERVRAVVGQAALALATAHEAGVVHRDVKPANILVTPEGAVKLTDFGIARAIDGSGNTLTGEILGTPHYLSPEQALGEAATGASDLYALGVVAHEMLTGRRPFEKNTPVATALAQVNDPPPPLPDHVPDDLRRVVDACLAKRAADRPASAREVAASLGVADPDGSGPTTAPLAVDVLGRAAERDAEREVAAARDAEVASPATPATPATPTPPPGRTPTPTHAPAATAAALAALAAGPLSDPTPTPTRPEALKDRRVHWAWVPAMAVVAVLATALVAAFAR